MARKSQKTEVKSRTLTSPIRVKRAKTDKRPQTSLADFDARQSFAITQTSPVDGGRRFGFFPPLTKRTIVIGIIVIGVVVLGYYKRNWIVAATVNGAPIFNTEVIGRLNEQFREETLSQMINEKIILNEASKKGIRVIQAEVDERIAKIEEEVGGAAALDAYLAQRQQKRDDLRSQLTLQLTIEKIYANDATVSAEEVDAFIAENKAQLQATDSAKQRDEAAEILKQQKLSKSFNESFPQLREQANIQIF